jgi:hypothetical protein
VAITKIDVEGADPARVERELIQAGLGLLEAGNIPSVHISSKTGHNMDLLLDLLLEEAKALALK